MSRLPYLALLLLGLWHIYTLLPPLWYGQTQVRLASVVIGSAVMLMAVGFLAGAAFMAGRRS
jgi:hypothetical protein